MKLFYFAFCVASLSACYGEKLIVVDRTDGGVSVVVPAENRRPDETEQEYLERVRAAACESIDEVGYRYVNREDLPKDRYFRDAWVPHNNGASVSRRLAEKIHRTRLSRLAKRARTVLLKKWTEAQATGDAAGASVISAQISGISSAAIDATDLSIREAPTLSDLKEIMPLALDDAIRSLQSPD